MPDENSQRIDRLESHLAQLQHQVEQLNGAVIEQGKLLDWLRKETQRQSGAMQTLELERMKSNVQKPPALTMLEYQKHTAEGCQPPRSVPIATPVAACSRR